MYGEECQYLSKIRARSDSKLDTLSTGGMLLHLKEVESLGVPDGDTPRQTEAVVVGGKPDAELSFSIPGIQNRYTRRRKIELMLQ